MVDPETPDMKLRFNPLEGLPTRQPPQEGQWDMGYDPVRELSQTFGLRIGKQNPYADLPPKRRIGAMLNAKRTIQAAQEEEAAVESERIGLEAELDAIAQSPEKLAALRRQMAAMRAPDRPAPVQPGLPNQGAALGAALGGLLSGDWSSASQALQRQTVADANLSNQTAGLKWQDDVDAMESRRRALEMEYAELTNQLNSARSTVSGQRKIEADAREGQMDRESRERMAGMGVEGRGRNAELSAETRIRVAQINAERAKDVEALRQGRAGAELQSVYNAAIRMGQPEDVALAITFASQNKDIAQGEATTKRADIDAKVADARIEKWRNDTRQADERLAENKQQFDRAITLRRQTEARIAAGQAGPSEIVQTNKEIADLRKRLLAEQTKARTQKDIALEDFVDAPANPNDPVYQEAQERYRKALAWYRSIENQLKELNPIPVEAAPPAKPSGNRPMRLSGPIGK